MIRTRVSVVIAIVGLAVSAVWFAGLAPRNAQAQQPHASPPKTADQKPKFVTGEGTVIGLRPEKQQIVLEHGEIKGFMGAMTMGYKTNPTSLLNSVKPGDKVRFTIDTNARAITKIDKLKD